ncbi:MAG TPA: CBS domain-containing protein [Pirellulaceae bacterium]|nr:CBS domain-containing protein [Pirellulaceae bacterium]HMO93320.1 CBS domain-containing protein [Pirellulaceae bacterium]HMP69141.1 CBS domain-containing protein [Pirellulaceae bacterium]
MNLEKSNCPDLNDPVVQHMRTEFARMNVDETVGQALIQLRNQPPAGRFTYFYVVDGQGSLCGVVPTRRLLLNPESARVRDIMDGEVTSIPDTATVLEACQFFVEHRFLAFPVVNSQNRVVGVVDVDLYTSELAEIDLRNSHVDLFQLIGVHVKQAQQASSWAAYRTRFPWLLTNIAGGLLAAFLSGLFQVELEKAVALALFIPIVLALAESVSIQSVSLALQILHSTRPTWPSIFAKMRQEIVTGALLGLTCALLVATVAILWLRDMNVTLCLLGGIAGGVICAAMIGTAIPNTLRLFKREPQVASGPIALASTDVVTLLIYFSLARLLIV